MRRGRQQKKKKKTVDDVYGDEIDTEDANDGFFVFRSAQEEHHLPMEIFRDILSYIPAYPYYFTLCRVSKQWYNEMENFYPTVEILDAVNRYKYKSVLKNHVLTHQTANHNFNATVQLGTDTVRYEPIYTENETIDKASIITKKFPNVTTLRIDYDGVYHSLSNIGKIVSGLKKLEKVVFINNPHKRAYETDMQAMNEILNVAPKTFKSLTLDGFYPRQTIQTLVNRCNVNNTYSYKLQEVSFVNMFASSENELQYYTVHYFSELKSHLGDKFTCSIINLTKKQDIETYIHNVKKEGMSINYILKANGNDANVMCTALRQESVMLFDVLWNELLQQVDNKEPLPISLPTVQSLLSCKNTSFIKHVVDTVTSLSTPERLRVDVNTTGEINISQSRLYAPDKIITCTLLGKATIENNTELVTYFESLNIPIVVDGCTNLLLAIFKQNEDEKVNHLPLFQAVLDKHATMLMLGNAEGVITGEEERYQPLCDLLLFSDGTAEKRFLEVFKLLHERGVPLTMVDGRGKIPIEHACHRSLFEFVDYMLDVMGTELQGTEQNCMTLLINEVFGYKIATAFQIVKAFANKFGNEWIQKLRFKNNMNMLQALADRDNMTEEFANFLIKDCNIDPNSQDDQGNNALNLFSTYGGRDFKLLYDLGCDPCLPNKKNITCLEKMIIHNWSRVRDLCNAHEKVMTTLLETARMHANKNVYHVISELSDRDIEYYISSMPVLSLEKLWYLVQTPDDHGVTPFMQFVQVNDVNTKNFIYNNERFFAHFTELPVTIGGDILPLQYLASKGLEKTPLYAYYLEHSKGAQLLAGKGGEATVLHNIISNGTTAKLVEKLLLSMKVKLTQEEFSKFIDQRQGSSEDYEKNGKSALVIAAEQGSVPIMNMLIKFGASTDTTPHNLVRCMMNSGHASVALQCMCGESYDSEITLPMLVSAIRLCLGGDDKQKESGVVSALEKLVQDTSNDEKNQLFELFVAIPDVMVTKTTTFADHCSVFQLLCNYKKHTIVAWILDTFADLLNAETTPFKDHPIDMLCACESLYKNTFFHFACTDTDLRVLTKKPSEDGTVKVNQVATKALFTKLTSVKKINDKNLLEQVNEHGDSPLHISCKSNVYSVWAGMLELGVDFTTPNGAGIEPEELITAHNAGTAFKKILKSTGNTAPKAKKEVQAKSEPAPKEKKAQTKRKRKEEEEEEQPVEEETETTGRPTRKRTKKSYVYNYD